MKQNCTQRLCMHIAEGNANEAVQVLRQTGMIKQPPQSKSQIAKSLYQMVEQKGEPALIKLAYIHPDRDLILENCKKDQSGYAPTDTGWPLNTYAADGNEDDPDPLDEKTNRTLIMGGAFILATALVTVILTSNQ